MGAKYQNARPSSSSACRASDEAQPFDASRREPGGFGRILLGIAGPIDLRGLCGRPGDGDWTPAWPPWETRRASRFTPRRTARSPLVTGSTDVRCGKGPERGLRTFTMHQHSTSRDRRGKPEPVADGSGAGYKGKRPVLATTPVDRGSRDTSWTHTSLTQLLEAVRAGRISPRPRPPRSSAPAPFEETGGSPRSTSTAASAAGSPR